MSAARSQTQLPSGHRNPQPPRRWRLNNATNASYIAASYVKFVESGGARVIPLVYNEPPQILHKKLNLVNGVLLPAVSTKKVIYIDVVESIFTNVVRRNDAGDRFPLLAICLGFELLAIIVGKGILEVFNAKDEASNLQFMKNTSLAGAFFERFPPSLLKKLATECLTMENHHYGISPKKFQKNKYLYSFFKILTTSVCKDNKVYVSTVQARKYPVTAFEWHPEHVPYKIMGFKNLKNYCLPSSRNAFQWGLPGIPHSEAAVQVTQNVANYFVREARESIKRPSPGEILEHLIYKHKHTYSGRAG
ncbi:Gamma-glutamyl hydrolase [Handroanthus impetiginosus]|uniref:folate gamma-glutamyl hydrolase n=1 Tax=Handroanthus impetiginosus TaxID=429701 RepID=A0A2G9I6W6_9LAMI|nr:Gamma-glutamyl hydrolase [Handroanthus impetiginosus]